MLYYHIDTDAGALISSPNLAKKPLVASLVRTRRLWGGGGSRGGAVVYQQLTSERSVKIVHLMLNSDELVAHILQPAVMAVSL